MFLVRSARIPAQDERGWTRAGIIGSILVFVVAATCVRLGIWQLDRLEQRRAVNALAVERMAQPPIAADDVAQDSAGAAFRRLHLTGSCEPPPIVLAARSRNGRPGVHLLCRFITDGGRVLLLDRGWAPSPDARTVPPELLAAGPRDTVIEALAIPFPPGSATTRSSADRRIEQTEDGVRLSEPEPRVIYRLNRTQAQVVVGTELPAWYAQVVDAGTPPPQPADTAQSQSAGSALPIPVEPPDLSEGPHFSYAVQWFSFATIALVGWLVLVVRRRPPTGTRPIREPDA